MNTKVQKIDPLNLNELDLKEAKDFILNGDIVAFPTETVYGLGGNAFNPESIEKIFIAKGRPQDNPLIVHISSLEMLKRIVLDIPANAKPLIEHFWPGPLTILFKKNDRIPDIVTASLPTVAIRMPSNPIAKKLIELTDVPIAAPSANSSGKPSPTSADHVFQDLKGKIPLIIDGGICQVGVESTVLSLEHEIPVILRPGGVTIESLKKIIPNVIFYNQLTESKQLEEKPPTPGLKYRHYAPKADLILFRGKEDNVFNAITNYAYDLIKAQKRVGIVQFTDKFRYDKQISDKDQCIIIQLHYNKGYNEIARELYSILRELDQKLVDYILFEGIPEIDLGTTVMNRLKKAAVKILDV